MNEEHHQRLQAWVDGELDAASAQEVAAWVQREPAAAALADNLRRFAHVLQQSEPTLAVPESRDFYWSKIRRGIELAEAAESRAQAAHASPTHASPLRWLAWLLPVGAATLAALFFFRPNEAFSPVQSAAKRPAITNHEIETPSADVTSLTFYSAQEGLTVVWLGTVDFL